jgi:hypothetical protein
MAFETDAVLRGVEDMVIVRCVRIMAYNTSIVHERLVGRAHVKLRLILVTAGTQIRFTGGGELFEIRRMGIMAFHAPAVTGGRVLM